MTPGLSDDFLAAIRAIRADQSLTGADSEVTVIAVSGAMAAALQVLVQREPAEHAHIADSLTGDMLRMLGADETLVAELLAAPCPPTSDVSTQPAQA